MSDELSQRADKLIRHAAGREPPADQTPEPAEPFSAEPPPDEFDVEKWRLQAAARAFGMDRAEWAAARLRGTAPDELAVEAAELLEVAQAAGVFEPEPPEATMDGGVRRHIEQPPSLGAEIQAELEAMRERRWSRGRQIDREARPPINHDINE